MPSVELLRADVRDELDKIGRLLAEFADIEDTLGRPADEVRFYDRAAIGYFLHSFYNGSENIFRSIAAFFENDLEPESWHASLLKRMKLEVPGFRPAVIDETLYQLLEEFRGFRHVFRHAYSFELDWDREKLVAAKMRRTAELLRQQVESFLDRLTELESQ